MTPRNRERNRQYLRNRLRAIEAEIDLLRLDDLPGGPEAGSDDRLNRAGNILYAAVREAAATLEVT